MITFKSTDPKSNICQILTITTIPARSVKLNLKILKYILGMLKPKYIVNVAVYGYNCSGLILDNFQPDS